MARADSDKSSLMAEYVINNIDDAIKNGWIKVYYQPVIRSLTAHLCGCEALARWIDPEVGFLSPDKFIKALEDSKQIHKLDCYMVECICKELALRISQDLPAVPVSVNFSRLDFEATDMLKAVEDNVRKYDLSRDYLHIEITESMIASDAELMESVIESFRKTGYEVWMDDFGSGYSSLNLLKDYNFDTLKMDMGFLSSFTERSKAIMTATITMAKEIGIKTLAEGVEEKEQALFLKSIGCGKLQGYYFGKPMPIDGMYAHMEERDYRIEERQWHYYYDAASFNARYTAEPLEVVEDDGKQFYTLFMNEPYKRQIFNDGVSVEEADRRIYNTGSPLIKKYRQFAEKMEQTGNLETFYYTNDGNILKFSGQVIASNAGRHLIKGALWNISADSNVTKRNSLDFRLKELNHLFELVMQINISTNKILPLLGKYSYGQDKYVNNNDLRFRIGRFTEEIISPRDRSKFESFMDTETLRVRIEESQKGFIENVFRVKQPDGSFRWKEISLMMIPGTGAREYLYCIKSTSDDAGKFLTDATDDIMAQIDQFAEVKESVSSNMFKNFMEFSSVKFFWKDTERKYLGASKAFLDFFHAEKPDDIIGRTGDRNNWELNSNQYVENELAVINQGKSFKNVPCQCIIDGVVHNISYNKLPLYDNGKIIGIMGFFVDVDEEIDRIENFKGLSRIDDITGLMSAKGFVEVNMDYGRQYVDYGQNYGLIILRIRNYESIVETFGRQFGNKLLKLAATTIVDATAQSCVVARVKEAYFTILTHINEKSELEIIADQLKEKVEAITSLEDKPVTVRAVVSNRIRTEEGTTDENMYQYVLSEV